MQALEVDGVDVNLPSVLWYAAGAIFGSEESQQKLKQVKLVVYVIWVCYAASVTLLTQQRTHDPRLMPFKGSVSGKQMCYKHHVCLLPGLLCDHHLI
jgi:hypothetical protein